MPGSEKTALKCDTVSRNKIMLKATTLKAPQSLQEREKKMQNINIMLRVQN